MYDERASIVIGVNGVLITIILAAVELSAEFRRSTPLTEIRFNMLLVIAELFLLILSMILAAAALVPARAMPLPDFENIIEGIERIKVFCKFLESNVISEKRIFLVWSYVLFLVSMILMFSSVMLIVLRVSM